MEKIKILIIEDDQKILDLYNKFISDKVFEKQFVKDGKEGLKQYEIMKPDLIILDIMLPSMSGYMVLKEIRLNINDKKTPIIMSTSVSRKESVLDCVKLGIQGYIVKPFSPKEVQDKILEFYSMAEPEKTKEALNSLKQ